jgi:hypothetical protein
LKFFEQDAETKELKEWFRGLHVAVNTRFVVNPRGFGPFKGIYRAATAVTMLSKRIVLFAPFDT